MIYVMLLMIGFYLGFGIACCFKLSSEISKEEEKREIKKSR